MPKKKVAPKAVARKTSVPPAESRVKSTVSRNSPLPKPQVGKPPVSHEQVAKRAYEIYLSGKGGSQLDNWLRAERELKGS